MTVLQRDTATGLGQRGKQVMIGLAMVIVGLAAAYGIGRLVTDSGATASLSEHGALMNAHVDTLTATGLAQIEALEEAALLEQRFETGRVQQQLTQQVAAARAESQVDAVRRNLWPAPGAAQSATWTLEDEIAAIERNLWPLVQPAPTPLAQRRSGPQ